MTTPKSLQIFLDDENDKNNSKAQKGPKPKLKSDKSKDESAGGGDALQVGKSSKSRKKLPSIQTVERSVLQCIVGQDEPVRQIITAIYKSIVFKSLRSNLLIIGGSGTGKTETVKQVLKRLNVPYTIEDATKYTQEGYYGADVEEMVQHLFENAEQDLERAQNGVIVIDEIDKKASRGFSGDRDVSGSEVLNSLLKIIEGSTVIVETDKKPFIFEFDTSNVMIIFMGAFSGLDKIRDERLKVNQVGFSIPENSKSRQDTRLLKQDLVQYGLPEEFVGRIGTIVEMNKLTKKDLVMILKNSKLSIFRKYQQELKERGLILSYSGRLFECIAEKSLSLDTGARELTNTVNYMFEGIMYEVLSDPSKYQKRKYIPTYKRCRLYLDIVNDNTQYRIFNKKHSSSGIVVDGD